MFDSFECLKSAVKLFLCRFMYFFSPRNIQSYLIICYTLLHFKEILLNNINPYIDCNIFNILILLRKKIKESIFKLNSILELNLNKR